MQSSQGNHKNPHNPSQKRPFAPFMANTLEFQGDSGFFFDSVSYNERHNLIIACRADNSVKFYDATTLLPSKEFDPHVLDRGVVGMSFCPDTETFIFGCRHGEIYTYNLFKKTLQKFEQRFKTYLHGVVFLNSSYYAYSVLDSYQIYVGNFENEDLLHSFPERSDVFDLKSLPKRNLLFSRLADGSLVMYRTDRLAKLPSLDSIRGKRGGSKKIQSITINGRDYLLSKRNNTIELWHLIKGKMRRLKVIQIPEDLQVSSMVYLEDYRMITTTHKTREIRFWGLFSGKLEYTLDVGMDECNHSFWMRDKNALGIVGWNKNTIKIVQLYPL